MRRAMLGVILSAILALTACSAGEKLDMQQPVKPVILGFSQLGSESGWRIGNTRSIISAAERAGVDRKSVV